MARYDRSYDYGLRGYHETAGFRRDREPRPIRYDYDFGFRGHPNEFYPNRVTARYNVDYTYDDHDPRYTRRQYPYGREFDDRIVGADEYSRPYYTTGGTHTGRGRTPPRRVYDGDFGSERRFSRYDRPYLRRY